MATFTTALLFAFLAGASANSPVMRKQEKEEMAVYLNSEGKAVHSTKQQAAVNHHSNKAVKLDMHQGAHVHVDDFVDDPNNDQSCNVDFILGSADSSDCTNSTDAHAIIIDSGMCLKAATWTGAQTHSATFFIPATRKDTHPKGCFSGPCTDAAGVALVGGGTCFFYNGIDDKPLNPKGTPVCTRPRFLNGTKDTNGLTTAPLQDCPLGYSIVFDEKMCAEAGTCHGHGDGDPFLKAVTNNSKHEEYPEGCFIDEVNDLVYFNPSLLWRSASFGKPADPHGTPLCNVTESTLCVAGGDCAVASSHLLPVASVTITAGMAR